MAASKAVKFGQHLKELRIHLCQKSAGSKGARDFLEQFYVPLKQSNPKFPILVRECSGIQPMIWARYDLGRELSVPVAGKSSKEVLSTVEMLAQKTA
ncbi:NADH dehydrogenase [ubiquinone] 1 alpha subcomplex subunit 2 [Lamellibrachia satsuma]|nr:NADH dehydrogenase [ubiquinone] 1 alpha subcomplex subunit 2 [Lamellibrachia satsuma]